MQTITSISSNFFKKSILLYPSFSINPFSLSNLPKKLSTAPQIRTKTHAYSPARVMALAHGPPCMTGTSPPEIPMPHQPPHEPAVPPEMPQRPNVPDFNPIPPEFPVDPPPLSPGPNPGPEIPDPVPPVPEAPRPPGEPEIVPPHGPDVIPPLTPEPGPPNPTQPDMPPLIMGSDGLVSY